MNSLLQSYEIEFGKIPDLGWFLIGRFYFINSLKNAYFQSVVIFMENPIAPIAMEILFCERLCRAKKIGMESGK